MVLSWLPAILGLIAAFAGLISLFVLRKAFLRSSSIYYLFAAVIFSAITFIAKLDSQPMDVSYQLASLNENTASDSITVLNPQFFAATTNPADLEETVSDDLVSITILSYPKAKVYIAQRYQGKTPLTVTIPKGANIPYAVEAPISPIGKYEIYKGYLNENESKTINVWLKQR